MKRYTKKELEGLDDFEFASLILQERANDLLNPYSPLSEKLRGAIHTLKEAHDRIATKPSDSREELFRLVRENPELPVVPMVDGEIVAGDSWGYWMGALGNAVIDEYLVCNRYAWEGQVLFKSDDDVFDTLEKYLPPAEFESLPEEEAECRADYDALPWVKAIIVYIKTPE